MEEGLCTAGLDVPYPCNAGTESTWNLLQSMLLVNWSWNLFIWDLRELYRLLTMAPAEFNYLFVTAFVKARAAYLAATGPFDCTQQTILAALGAKCVQFAAIYYRLLLAMLRDVLGSETAAKLIGNREERLFELAIREVERRYIEILEVIALSPGMDEEIHGHDIESWVTGTELRDGRRVSVIPRAVQVPVMAQRYGRHRLVRPCARETVRKIKKREAFRSFLQRAGTVNGTDMEIEKLSRFPKVDGCPVVRYGDLEVQYYLTLTNAEKTTLYVVCADRTMRMHQRRGVPPGSRPRSIDAAEDAAPGEELYVVTFDSGASGIFAIDFRPHKESEHMHVPEGVWRVRGAGAAKSAGVSECGSMRVGPASSPQRELRRGDSARAESEDGKLKTECAVPVGRQGVRNAECGESGASALLTGKRGDRRDGSDAARIEGDFRVIRLAGGKVVDLRTKHKARGVLRFICAEAKRTGQKEFDVEVVREAYNAEFPDHLAHRRWKCDRFREDLFKGKEREFDLLFETVDKALGRYRVKV